MENFFLLPPLSSLFLFFSLSFLIHLSITFCGVSIFSSSGDLSIRPRLNTASIVCVKESREFHLLLTFLIDIYKNFSLTLHYVGRKKIVSVTYMHILGQYVTADEERGCSILYIH